MLSFSQRIGVLKKNEILINFSLDMIINTPKIDEILKKFTFDMIINDFNFKFLTLK